MIIIKIGKYKIKCPTNIREITLRKGIDLFGFLEQSPVNHNSKIAIISMLTGLDAIIVSNFSQADIDLIYTKLNFEKTNFHHPTTFLFQHTLYGLIDFEIITVKEYADIDRLLKDSTTAYDNLVELTSILFRPIRHKNNPLFLILLNIIYNIRFRNIIPQFYTKYTVAEYTEREYKFKELIAQKWSFEIGLVTLYQIIRFKNKLKKDFYLLYPTTEQVEELKKYGTDDSTTLSVNEIWGIYDTVCTISNSLSEREQWWNKPLKELYTYLSYLKQKNLEDKK